jgi:hypothetical protein
MPETIEKQPKLMNKTLEAFKLVEAGLEPREALKAVNYTSKISPQSVSLFKNKLKKYSLSQPKIIKSAHNQLKRILAGEVREIEQQAVTKAGQVIDYTETIAPSDTNILAAVGMVYDRYEPAVKVQANINANVSPVDLSRYSNDVIDVTPVDKSPD